MNSGESTKKLQTKFSGTNDFKWLKDRNCYFAETEEDLKKDSISNFKCEIKKDSVDTNKFLKVFETQMHEEASEKQLQISSKLLVSKVPSDDRANHSQQPIEIIKDGTRIINVPKTRHFDENFEIDKKLPQGGGDFDIGEGGDFIREDHKFRDYIEQPKYEGGEMQHVSSILDIDKEYLSSDESLREAKFEYVQQNNLNNEKRPKAKLVMDQEHKREINVEKYHSKLLQEDNKRHMHATKLPSALSHEGTKFDYFQGNIAIKDKVRCNYNSSKLKANYPQDDSTTVKDMKCEYVRPGEFCETLKEELKSENTSKSVSQSTQLHTRKKPKSHYKLHNKDNDKKNDEQLKLSQNEPKVKLSNENKEKKKSTNQNRETYSNAREISEPGCDTLDARKKRRTHFLIERSSLSSKSYSRSKERKKKDLKLMDRRKSKDKSKNRQAKLIGLATIIVALLGTFIWLIQHISKDKGIMKFLK